MKKQFIKGTLIKGKGDQIQFIASNESRDRHGDVIPLDSWDLSNFLRAPRMLIDHFHSVEKIVGKWENVHINRGGENEGLVMDANFHDITELSKQTHEMVKKGFLNTVSVGFIPHIDVKQDSNGADMEVARNELIEVSLVTVPANADAERIKELADMQEKAEEGCKDQIDAFLKCGIGNDDEVPVKAVVKCTCGESKHNEDKPKEISKDTPKDQGKSVKGRSLTKTERQNIVLRKALKEAVKIMNFTLNRIKK